MKRNWILLAAVIGTGTLALAQTMPPAPPSDRGGEPRERDGGGPPPPPEGMEPGRGPGGRGGDRPEQSGGSLEDRMRDRRERGMQGPPPPLRNPVDAMRQYLDLVDKYTEMAKDPSASGVSAVVTLAELAKQQGPSVAIEKLNALLPEAKDEAVKRAIRLNLIDLYKAAGQVDKAIEQAEILIKGG